MTIISEVVLMILVIYLLFTGVYQIFLVLCYFLIKEPPDSNNNEQITNKFAVLVPSHDEELLIASFCESILSIEYLKDQYDVFIIADNCSDQTEGICLQYPVTVLSRQDTTKLGKGYALDWALEQIDINDYGAVMVLDADTTVDPSILSELNRMLNKGEVAIQSFIDVPNRDETWFTQLIYLSRTINNLFYHYAKHKLGLSSYLMGTGMCFKTSLLKKMKWNAYSLSEDWEYYAKLIEKGYRIGFSIRSIIHQQESSNLSQATSQRLRWSSGRFYVLKTLGLNLLFKGIKNKDLVTADASLALLLPNWSLQVNLLIVGLIFSLFLIGSEIGVVLFGIISCLLMLQVFIVIAGSFLTGQPLKTLKSVMYAPVFLIWKMVIDFLCITKLYKGKEWIRTSRHIPK